MSKASWSTVSSTESYFQFERQILNNSHIKLFTHMHEIGIVGVALVRATTNSCHGNHSKAHFHGNRHNAATVPW